MLVLSRKTNEAIVIVAGKQVIRVTLIDVHGDRCRIGCEADKSISIDREEIYDAKRTECYRKVA